MSKFNRPTTRPAVHGPIVTASTPAGTTHEGALGYARDAKSELFLLAVSNMAGEGSFYESADARDARLVALTRTVAVADPAWILGFTGWLRGEGNMRSTSLVIAAEAVKAMLAAGDSPATCDESGCSVTAQWGDADGCKWCDRHRHSLVARLRTSIPGGRQIIASVLQRADEPGEMLAYWTSKYGRKLPMPVKRGVADAAVRLYTEYSLLKYDTASKGFRFGDVLDLTHPSAGTPEQGHLFRHALDRRHGNDNLQLIAEHLPMVYANVILRSTPVERLLDTDRLKVAGMTWEDVLPLAGNKVDKRKLWEALIPTMGYMATLRNLRNFDEAGVSDAVAATVAARLADPEQVAKSRQFPFRFLAAHRNVPSLRWGHALDVALTASLASVPELSGRTLVLIDRSISMFGTVSKQSELTWADSAAVFGSALALRNVGRADLVQYGDSSQQIHVKAGDSLLKTVERFRNMGGTETLAAVRAHYRGHDRVVLVTDEQAWAGYGDPGSAVPANVPLYTVNLAGYRYGHGPGGPNRHTFGSLTDASFKVITLLENHRDGRWPWES